MYYIIASTETEHSWTMSGRGEEGREGGRISRLLAFNIFKIVERLKSTHTIKSAYVTPHFIKCT